MSSLSIHSSVALTYNQPSISNFPISKSWSASKSIVMMLVQDVHETEWSHDYMHESDVVSGLGKLQSDGTVINCSVCNITINMRRIIICITGSYIESNTSKKASYRILSVKYKG